MGNICGGFNVKGQSHDIKKTFNDLPYGGQTFEISLDFIKIDSWDNEYAYVEVNGIVCWGKRMVGSNGKQTCGQKGNEERIPVKCRGQSKNRQFTVRVYTTLNSGASDGSFGIDNAVLQQLTGATSGGGCGAFAPIRADFQKTSDQQGWSCGKITNCGSFGNICGGFNTKAKSHDIKKTFKNLPAGKYQISLDFIKIDSWDNEYGYVQVNGKTCWSKRMVASSGKQTCGQKHGNWHEERIPVKCTGDAKNGQFVVRIYTTLNSGASDESFGIDNAVLTQVGGATSGGGCGAFAPIRADFQKTSDQQGWSCGKITNCGSFGNICGGFNTKAKSHDIKKTFKNLPAG